MPYFALVAPVLSLAGKAVDWALKDAPSMQLWPERFLGGANVYMYLAVHNPGKHSIHVREISATSGLFEVWKDASAEAAGAGMAGEFAEFILQAGETKYLPILAKDRREENNDVPSWIRLRWRSLQHPGRPRIPVTLKTTHAEYDRVEGAA